MTYRFYLTVGSTVTEVFPLNFLETSLVDELEKDQIFYRRKFQGSLTFVNTNGDDDFDLLYFIEQTDPCSKLLFSIERSGVAYWNGNFTTTDGKFDLDKCTFEVVPLPEDNYTSLFESLGTEYNILLVTPSVTTTAIIPLKTDTIFTRNRWLFDVIEYIAEQIKPGVTVSSTFFTAATNPVTLQANKLLYLTIAQKSDILRPTSTDPATQAKLSWKGLMDILWGMFQVRWDYDLATDTILVEHISYFSGGSGLDLRTQLISKASNKYAYIKEEMPRWEKFNFMEASGYNFFAVPINYDSNCVNQDPESNSTEIVLNVTTDIEYMINYPEQISDAGFVILCNYLDTGQYYVKWGIGAGDGLMALNAHLSWANLHNNYFRHNRVLIEGNMNAALTTFWTAKKTKKQETFAIVCPEDGFDPSEEVTTELGETYFSGAKGKVQRAELNPNGELKLSLLYGPPDNENTGVVESEGMLIYQGVDCISLEATLFAEMDIDRDIIVTEIVYDDEGVLFCTGAPETWTILEGSLTSSFTLASPCAGVGEGFRIELSFDVSYLGTWAYRYFVRENCLNYV